MTSPHRDRVALVFVAALAALSFVALPATAEAHTAFAGDRRAAARPALAAAAPAEAPKAQAEAQGTPITRPAPAEDPKAAGPAGGDAAARPPRQGPPPRPPSHADKADHYTYAGMRAITLLDDLSQIPLNPFRIDRTRFGVIGASMGGQFTYYVNGLDSRVKGAVAIAVAGDWRKMLSYEGSWLYHGIYYYTRDGLPPALEHFPADSLPVPSPPACLATLR